MKSNSMFEEGRRHPHCGHHQPENPMKKVVLALLLIGAGVLALLSNLNILPYSVHHIVFSWQMLLIAIGVIMLFGRRKTMSGVVLIVVGTVFILPEIVIFPFPTHLMFWPAILIAVGLIVLFKKDHSFEESFKKSFSDESMNSNDFINDNHVFGGGNYIITSDSFKGGKINSVFGGGKYDFVRSKLAEGNANVLNVSLIFGGLEIIVPASWDVKVEVDSIFGGFSNKRNDYNNQAVDHSKQLIIRGSAIFGGGEIKRV